MTSNFGETILDDRKGTIEYYGSWSDGFYSPILNGPIYSNRTAFFSITGWFNPMNRLSSCSSVTNCNESWFVILVKEQNRVSLIPLKRFSCCKKRAWDDMLLDSCFWAVNYPWMPSIHSRMLILSSKAIYISPIDSNERIVLLWNSTVLTRWLRCREN